ncbi:MAG: recombinase family protein [Clostridiales bacterium]|nr:recombinase family protein [Candidatus Cacconaster stercorequi]
MSDLKIAAAYIRVSTDDQEEYSPDSQIRIIREYAKKNGYLIPDDYVFQDDGISAATARKRPAFTRMIAMAKEKEKPFDAILVLMFSRFCRNREESVLYKGLLRKQGISVISVKEPAIDGPFGTLIESIIEWFDEYYLINLSSEVKRGMTEKFLRGEAMGTAPFGYRIDSANKTYIVDVDRADIVRRVFHRYADGAGFREIAAELNAIGVTTRRGNPPDNRFVEYMLRNPVYIGKIRWTPDHKTKYSRVHVDDGVQLVAGKHPPIIDQALWDAVQQRMDQRKASYGRYQRQDDVANWMLKGLVRCSSCGSTLILAGLKTNSPFLQCHKYAKGSCAVSHCLSQRKAEAALMSALSDAVANLDFTMTPHRTSAPRQTVDYARLIEQEQRKLSRCKDAYQSGIDTLEEYRENKSRITENIRRLQEQEANTSVDPLDFDKTAYAEKVSGVLSFIQSDATPDAKNKALRTIIDHIVYDKANHRLAIYFYI